MLVEDGEIRRSEDRAGGRDSGGQRACRAARERRRQRPQRGRGGARRRRISPAGRRSGATQGQALTIEVTRAAIPGSEPWKRPLAQGQRQAAGDIAAARGQARRKAAAFPGPSDGLARLGRCDRRSANRRRQLCRRRAADFLHPGDDADRCRRLSSAGRAGGAPARPKRPRRFAASTSAGRSGSTCRPCEARPLARPRRRRSTRSCPSRSSGPRSTASASSRSSGRALDASLLELAQDRAGVRGPRPAAPRGVRETGRQAARCAPRGGRRDRGEAALARSPGAPNRRRGRLARRSCPSHVGRVCRASLKRRAARSAASRSIPNRRRSAAAPARAATC